MKERFDYRVRKWILQHSPFGGNSNQFQRLDESEWDVLVILDACRYDTLSEIAPWPIESVLSPGSCTPQWLKRAVSASILHGTHVLSANPQYEKVDAELGCDEIEPLWESDWNDDLQTTLPEQVLDRTDEVLSKRSEVVAHLQQPHWPYVAQLGDSWKLAYDDLGPWEAGDGSTVSVQVAMQRGLIDTKEAQRAYRASVESTWKTLEEYLGQWVDQGHSVVVTADHGELFGRATDLFFYEHPCRCNIRPLVQVPWIELHPSTASNDSSNEVEDRLRALGYA